MWKTPAYTDFGVCRFFVCGLSGRSSTEAILSSTETEIYSTQIHISSTEVILWKLIVRCGADCSEIVRDDSVDREALFASWAAMASCGISFRVETPLRR